MRKGHGSSKVPNVKLRPAPINKPTRPASVQPSDEQLEDDHIAQDDTFEITVRRPLEGVVICCTGISDKPTLLAHAKSLGARHSSDYTDRITHLIASAPGSAKYQCALERMTPIMEPAWISRTYEKWLKGADVSLEESERQYRLPAFQGLWIAITGEHDVSRRASIAKIVTAESGRYCKDLSEKVTHLVVCSSPEDDSAPDSAKVQWAKAVNANRRRDGLTPEGLIKIVWEEWLWDCHEWQGKWDEAHYRIENPRPERKQLPQPPEPQEPPSFDMCTTSTQHLQQYGTPGSASSRPPTRAPTRLEAQRDAPPGGGDVEIARIRRVPQGTTGGAKSILEKQLWDDIVSNADQNAVSKNKRKRRARAADKLSDTEDEDDLPDKLPFLRSEFATKTSEKGAAGSTAQPPKTFLSRMRASRVDSYEAGTSASSGANSATSAQAVAGPSGLQAAASEWSDTPRPVEAAESATMDDTGTIRRVFSGLRLRTLGQASRDVLVTMVEQHGGTVIRSDDARDNLDDADFILVRLHEAPKFVDVKHPLLHKFRTECWVESCAFEERLCEVDEHVIFTPLNISFPVPGAETVQLVWSGVHASDSHFAKQLCKVLGIVVPDKFCRKTTHLICPERQGPKYQKAMAWGIPVHGLQWLWNIARTGVIEGYVAPSSLRRRDTIKGPIVDITNGSAEELQKPDDFVKPVKRSSRQVDAMPFGVVDTSILGDQSATPTKSGSSSTRSPTKPVRPLPPARMNTAPASPSKRPHRPSSLGKPSSSGSAPPPGLPRRDSMKLGSSIAALLGKHLQEESPETEENSPPRKKARPTSRAKTLMDSNRYSASVSPSHSSVSSVPIPPIHAQPTTMKGSGFDEEAEDDSKADAMQVFYADPTQEAEKERFMQLIESGEKPPAVKAGAASSKKKEAKKPPRRSTRKAGF